MKIAKITTAYPAYLRQMYALHPGLSELSYAEQKAIFDYDGFGWADFWAHSLGKLGYQAEEIRADILPLQEAWARENGFRVAPEESALDLAITRAQLQAFAPDVLFVDDYDYFSYAWLKEVRAACPSIRLVLGWCGAAYSDLEVFKAYDLTLSNIPAFVAEFRRLGHQSEHLHHAFDPRILNRIRLEPRPGDEVSFIGSIVRSQKFHRSREELLEQLVASTAIRIYSPNAESGVGDEFKAMAKLGAYAAVRALRHAGVPQPLLERLPRLSKIARLQSRPRAPVSRKLRPRLRPPVFGLRMFQVLRDSRLTVNSHVDVAAGHASNMRLFEATGVGTCLVTDRLSDLATLFKPDTEVVTYGSAAECVEKIQWLLNHPQQRAAIAAAGQKRTLSEHTFDKRAEALDALIRSRI